MILTGDYNSEAGNFSGKADTVPAFRGMGNYTASASREGIVKWRGTVSVKSRNGKILTYPFTSEYIVARPMVTVSAEKMNVLYMGVANPVSVSVPGIPAENITVAISSGTLKKISGGKYEATGQSAGDNYISVRAAMENGEVRDMGKIKFRVKGLPKPVSSFAGVFGTGKKAKNYLLAYKKIDVKYDENFDFAAKANITMFRMEIAYRGGMYSTTEESRSGNLTEKMTDMIRQLRKGEKITFFDIEAMGPDNRKQKLGPITITVD